MNIAAIWILLCIIWGTTWIFIKWGLDDLPPLTFAAARFAVACSILIPILLFRKISLMPPKNARQLVFVTGLLQFCLNYGLLFWGEQHISSGLAAILQASIPAFGLFLARFYTGEKITKLKIASDFIGTCRHCDYIQRPA